MVKFHIRHGGLDWSITQYSIEVAQPGGTNLAFTTLMGGEYHVVAVARNEIGLEVTDAKGYRATPGSFRHPIDRERGFTSVGQHLHIDSRESAKISLAGRGCVLLLVYRRW